ncbi:MAG: tetratricopeptide repeat protein [Bacteroidales bacterium]
MKYGLFFFLLILSVAVFSQHQKKVDSLLHSLKHDGKKSSLLNQLSELYLSSDPEISYTYAVRAFEQARDEDDKAQMGEALWLKARGHLYFNEYDRSNMLVDSAEFFFRQAGMQENIVNCQVMKASTLMLQGNYDEAMCLFHRAAEDARELGARHIYSSALLHMGRIHRARGNYEKALEDYELCLSVAKEIDHEFLIANAYYFIGSVFLDQHQYEPAIENYLQALPLYEKNNNFAQIPYLLVGLGNAYLDNKNFSEALRHFRNARSYYTKNKDRWGLNELYVQMGSVFQEMNQQDSAWYCFELSLKLSREINEKAAEANALHRLGEILLKREQYDTAMSYFGKALELNSKLVNSYTRCRILISKGNCLVKMGQPVKGLNVLTAGLAIADSMNLMTEQMMLHKHISSAYKKLNQFKNALVHYELHARLSDSLFRAESNLHFLEMERRYQSEKQKQEIGQLKLNVYEQEIRLRKQRSLRNFFILGFLFTSLTGFMIYRSYRIRKKADEEKEALLKEIHHRVKNNLQIISSLLSIQTDSLKDAKIISAVQESQSRVKAMGLIHQLLYQDNDLRQINFEMYLPQLVTAISSIFRKQENHVDITTEANNLSFEIDTAIPLGLIVAELSSNAFKYAFTSEKKGKLAIKIGKEQKHQYTLVVSDNGPGLTEGTRINELNSMGLRLVNILTDQLDGILSYSYNLGAEFTVKFTAS